MTLKARTLIAPRLASAPTTATLMETAMADLHMLMTARLCMKDLQLLAAAIDRQMMELSAAMDAQRVAIIHEVRAKRLGVQMYRQAKVARGIRCSYLYWRLSGNAAASHIDVYSHTHPAHHPFVDEINARNQQLTSAHAWLRYTRHVIRDFVPKQ